MPQLTCVVPVDERSRPVVGLTSFDRRLFVLHWPSEQQVDVYDTATFGRQQTLTIVGLGDHSWNSLASCATNVCVYVSDHVEATVYKVELSQPTDDDNEVLKWQLDSKPGGLSVSKARNLLVACFDANRLNEYTPDGLLIRDIRLRMDDFTVYPLHAVQLSGDRFLVSLRSESIAGPDALDDVVLVDAEGNVAISYERQLSSTTGRRLSYPCNLAVDDDEKLIFIADYYNDRVMMLNREASGAIKADRIN
jgi:hypothetical protein